MTRMIEAEVRDAARCIYGFRGWCYAVFDDGSFLGPVKLENAEIDNAAKTVKLQCVPVGKVLALVDEMTG